MARPTAGTPVVIKSSTQPYTGSVTLSGSGVLGMAVVIIQKRSGTESLSAPTWNGETGVLWSTDYLPGDFRANWYRFHNMAAATATLSVGASANRAAIVAAIPLAGLHATAAVAFPAVTEEADLSATVAGVTANQLLLSAAFGYDGAAAAIAYAVTGTGQTEIVNETPQSDVSLSVATQSETGSVTATFTVSGGTLDRSAIFVAPIEGAAAGPTIDTQPTAQTARLNGEPAPTATFTVAATTSGGALSYDWELETSVGGGSYANVADGSGATWTGQAGATLVGTFSAVTLSGRRLRCNVTDSNGTTTTSAVALTVLTGPVVSGGSTNGSGVLATNLTSDDALTANGEVLLITDTDALTATVVGRTTTRPA